MYRLKIIFFVIIYLAFSSAYSFSSNLEKFSVDQNILIYDTENIKNLELAEINDEDVELFFKFLSENPEIKTIHLNSAGGVQSFAYEISDLIIDFDLDTHINGICHSSCAIIFLAGNNRTIERGSTIGFHQLMWSANAQEEYYEFFLGENWTNEFEYAEWLYNDAQETVLLDMKYLLERGVEPSFAIKTLQADPYDMWIPRRKELLKSGVITK
tara:strand:- start:172 stop:810 length:639 start_codon:yes stop_codon:yes gene_type:complete